VSSRSAPDGGNGSGTPETADAAKQVQAETLRSLAVEIAATGRPHLLGPHGDHSAVLLEADDDQYQRWVGLLAGAGLAVRVGAGRPVDAASAVRDSLIDAALAVDALARAGERRGTLRFEDFSVADMLLCAADGARLRASAEALLAPLRDHPQLLEAVVAWFACDLNVNEAAARLHLHPNSLRYRLTRVDEVTGRALHALPNLVDLYLALRSEARLPLEILQKPASMSSSPTVPRPGRRS